MRVDLTTFGVEPPENGKTGRAGQAGASGSTANSNAAGASDGASIGTPGLDSFDQTRVQSLAAQVLTQPEIREAKVQSLQQAIANGEYSVSPGQVADALVSDLGGESEIRA
ncbi:MAG: flagellar biosynthesis anti-sigma factor FlgM [Terriglobales bacterium]|jgi:flagellar biosynthesis anti-sigma factor FlgM